jgi:hypothetical protein
MSQDAASETPPPVAPPQIPVRIPEADMFKVANAALRLQNVFLQEELLRRDKLQIMGELNSATNEVNTKYGLDPTKHRVLPDGSVVPANHPLAAGQRLPGA